ncbi:Mur ligase [Syncephalis pseudoplumigaleata]|uniref:Dihydrofolate synthetase n=1 Tax=Syncephalis pseudoplumigaleata TaxID=1712513 RepID=A0A4P9Z4X2_9FUNG|nr:Mur ligase [Syncephalis pseudoplumigaleata]|eukprot:RKP27647.1 Mur ligase [Syncephalis pseudoplumigaleata]
MELGLERVHALLGLFDQPQHRVPFIHVAGTNGKGSTSAFLASIYEQAGLRVGVFSSPHFLHPRDAIRINGRALALEAWTRWRGRVDAAVEQHLHGAPPTEFERETAVAWLVFHEARVDLAVVECGLGGRLDATNAGHDGEASCKLACIITPIGLDHQRLLGDTTTAIATEKAGIFLPRVPVILAAQPDDAAMRTLVAIAREMDCELVHGTTAAAWHGSPIEGNARIERAGNATLHVRMRLAGDAQLVNVATAIATVDTLKLSASSGITDDAIVKGVETARWPWRLEWLTVPQHLLPSSSSSSSASIRLLLDGAHNPDAARLLRQHVDSQLAAAPSSPRRVLWIVGLSAEKDAHGVLAELLRADDQLCAVPFSQPVAMPWVHCQSPDAIVAVAQQQLPSITAKAMPDIASALDYYARELPGHAGSSLLVVCGSLYLAADVYRLFGCTLDDLRACA